MGYDWRNPYSARNYQRRQRRLQRAREYAKAHPRPSKSKGSLVFKGWRWLCPQCNRPTRTLLYPLPPITLLPEGGVLSATLQPTTQHSGLSTQDSKHFACTHCHRPRYSSRIDRNAWNTLIAHLTAGLLFGHEVPKPNWLTPHRKRRYTPHTSRPPSKRREQVLELLLQNLPYKQIAKALKVGYSTVHDHAKKLYKQHNVHTRAQLAQKLHRPLPPRPTPTKQQQAQERFKAGQSRKQIAHEMNLTLHAVYHHTKGMGRHAKIPV